MDNETTPVVDSAAESSPAITTTAHNERQNTIASQPPNVTNTLLDSEEDGEIKKPKLERTSSISEEYMVFLRDPANEEKRFPVDRKKLEKLIVAGGKDHESAESYFNNIQEQTDTRILWPSKLKIGAKSKKDPQVKVIGRPAAVQKARELILADLDAKATRVTLKIDIPFSEHSHVIGKEGCNIKKVHEETKCHIHFPDSNRSVHGEKSNQVSITGQVIPVETARKRIRELLPAVVTFTLPMSSSHVEVNSPKIEEMMIAYNVNIHIKPQPQNYCMTIVIRGTVKNIDGVVLAVSKVVEYFTGDLQLPLVTLSLDIASQHHRTLIGQQGGNIRKIMEDTNTNIQFPDPQSRYYSNHVSVSGPIESVFKAREQLMGCLPVVLMFDVHESNENFLSSSVIGDLMKQLDVFISVKPKKGQLQSIIIKSIEQNLHCVYQTRIRLLECSYQPSQSGPPQDTIAITTSKDEPPMFKKATTVDRIPPVPFSPITEERAEDIPTPEALQAGITSLKPSSPDKEVTRSTSKSPDAKSVEGNRNGRFESSLELETSISPTDMRPRSKSTGQRTVTPPHRLTPRQFIDYDRKKEEAQKAMKSKVDSTTPRFPTPRFSGYNFSESMPTGPRDSVKSPTSPLSPSAVPQGLSSINRTVFQALARKASEDRFVLREQQQDSLYHGVSDLPTLLQRLGLEHYLQRFEEEEVDFETFLSMSEAHFKEMGITTVGAKRKLQIAILELKKIRSKPQQRESQLPQQQQHLRSHQEHHRIGVGLSSTLGRLPYQPPTSLQHTGNRGGSLKRSFNMSHGGRF